MAVWKWGCNFGGMQNPCHFDFLSDNNIVLGRQQFANYHVGDLVAVTSGFSVIAIGQVTNDCEPITARPDLEQEALAFEIEFADSTLVASANLVEPSELYRLPIQAGNRRIRKPEHIAAIQHLWKQTQ
jgi:hypothetical protein